MSIGLVEDAGPAGQNSGLRLEKGYAGAQEMVDFKHMPLIDPPIATRLGTDRRHRCAGTDITRSARQPINIGRAIHG